jgi:hypothetical protein
LTIPLRTLYMPSHAVPLPGQHLSDPLPPQSRGSRPIGWLRLLAPAVLLLPLACHATRPPTGDRAAPEVLAALRATGEAPVVVALVEPSGYPDPGADRQRIRAEIARMQEEVLQSLDPAEYRDRHRFESVPAMAGTLLSERALRTLLSHPHVRRVDLDPGGTGTGSTQAAAPPTLPSLMPSNKRR